MTLAEHSAKLNGLVLAGGKSSRMGTDKSKLQWHGTEQRYYIANLLRLFCDEVYISCRDAGQAEEMQGYPTLTDKYTDIGPYAGILTAMDTNPDAAWLVVACDLPLLDEATLRQLVDTRDTSCMATTFKSPHDGLPEPLITIWEPASGTVLRSMVSEGIKCPRKALMRHPERVKIILPDNAEALLNANTPEDAKVVHHIIESRKKHG